MIQTGFESKVKIQQIINNQLPEFILDESPKTAEFLKQYYISQEYQGGPIDIAENLDQYLKLDNLTPEVIVDSTYVTTEVGISTSDTVINVNNTKGFPQTYGLLKIDDEIITYTGITTNSFTGCIRGFSGITTYHSVLNEEELVFSNTETGIHAKNASVQNLSSLFLKEFYKKLKYTFTPGLEEYSFNSDINVGNFIKEARSFYQSKGTDESFRILFNILFGVTPKIINLEEFLIKPSYAQYTRRGIVIAEVVGFGGREVGNVHNLVGQSITKSSNASIDIDSSPISEIESFTRNNRQYFKLALYIADDEDNPQIDFEITPNTKCLETVAVGSSIISVDSTIGFAQTGTIVSGTNNITYTDKSVNQFFGCTGIETLINSTDNVRSNEIYYGYEDGDTSKKIELRLTGVLSKFEQVTENLKVNEGDILYVKNIGDLIDNPDENKTYKEIFANSWIYNTSSSYDIESFGQNLTLTLKDTVDKSGLKVGDEIEILIKGEVNVKYPILNETNIPYVVSISDDKRSIQLGGFNFEPENLNSITGISALDYVLRRKINTANSSSVPIKYGNDVIISDIQNLYVDQDNEYAYVASNSLPSYVKSNSSPYSYQITKNIKKSSINSSESLIDPIGGDRYSTLKFSDFIPFVSGDRIYYEADYSLDGLVSGEDYYIEVLSDQQSIKLYYSRSFIGSDKYISIAVPIDNAPFGIHNFTLYAQRINEIGPQKIFKKFTLNPNITNGTEQLTIPGATGMLINGVEINNYKSVNKIYYGPLESATVLNGGNDYDVINPPLLQVSSEKGLDAAIQPVIEGSIKRVYIDPQEFDINTIKSVDISGGNGSGAVLEPVIRIRFREVSLDGRTTTNSGGIDTTTEQITFITNHNFFNGQEIIYNSNENLPIGVGIGSSTLIHNGSYFVGVDNTTSITLYNNLNDSLSRTNKITFSGENATGLHKFKTKDIKKTVAEIRVIDGGKGYTNRKLIVKRAGISTVENNITFKNHGFKDGELISYSYDTTNLVTNGDFSDGTTGWKVDPTEPEGTISIINGHQLEVRTNSKAEPCQALQTLDTVVGEKYTLFYEILGGTASQKTVRLSHSASNTMDAIIYDYCWDHYQYFDVDGDGIVSPTDVLLFTKYLIGPAFNPHLNPGNFTSNLYVSSDATRNETQMWDFIDNHYNNTVINRGTYNGTDIGEKNVYDLDATGTVTSSGAGLMLARIFGFISGSSPNLTINTTNQFLNPNDGGPAQWDNVNLKWVMGSYSRQSIPQFGLGIVINAASISSPYWDSNSVAIYGDIGDSHLGSKSYEFTAVSDKLYIQPRIPVSESNVTAIFDNFYLKSMPIEGLSTANQYKILKQDNNNFQLADVTSTSITSTYANLKSQVHQGVINENLELVTDGAFSNSTNWRLGSNCTISNGAVSFLGGNTYPVDYIRQKPVTPFVEGNWYVLTADLVSGNGTHIGMADRNQSGVSQGNGSTAVDVYCEVVGGNKLIAMWKQNNQYLNEINLHSTSINNNWSNNPTVTGGSLLDTANGFDGLISSGSYCDLTATNSDDPANATFTASILNVTQVDVFAHSPSQDGDTRGTCLDSTGTTHYSSTITGQTAGWHTIYSGSAITLVNVGWGINQNPDGVSPAPSGTSSDGFRAFRVTVDSVPYILTDGVNSPPSTSAASFTNLSIKESPQLPIADSNYKRRNFVKFDSLAAGYQYFSYPDISVSLSYSLGGSNEYQVYKTLKLTPEIRGSIIDAYLYEPGTGYGSSVLNFEKNQVVSIKTGRDAQIKPHIVNGLIVDVSIDFGGYEYYSLPDLEVIDSSGSGSGAQLRPVISGGKIIDTIITSPGIGYSSSNTSIHVKSRGSNAIIDTKVRSLNVNNVVKYGDEYISQILSVSSGNIEDATGNIDYGYIESENKLQYAVGGYFDTLRNSFEEDSTIASNIIGWAYDGNPIYGPYAYSDPEDRDSYIRRLTSGYKLDVSNIIDRPSGFESGYFIEDYIYDGSGDLDSNNGRYGKTPEFPEGVYAYFATINELGNPIFPYFIGNTYRSNQLEENNELDQTFDFKSSNLLRNTFPYNVYKPNTNNDFLTETSESTSQLSIIESIKEGSITDFDIIDPGSNYKVNDILNFDNSNTEGGGVNAKVLSIKGKGVLNVDTSVESYDNAIFTWNDANEVKVSILPHHNLSNDDQIVISGFSTSLTELNNSYKIGVTSYTASVYKGVPETMGAATTEIYVSYIPDSVSVGSSVGIGTETLKILNIYKKLNLLRVKRQFTDVAISTSATIGFAPDSFTISSGSSIFTSRVDDKVYFNPVDSVGVGTTSGFSISTSFTLGDSVITRNILHRTIYLENHPFEDNQQVVFTRPSGSNQISISTSPKGAEFNIPTSGLSTTLYVTNKTINSIGIKTAIGVDHNGNPYEEVYFHSNGSNNDEYLLESVYLQKKGKVDKIVTTVSVSTYHGLLKDDIIDLNIKPNLSVGIGTSTSIEVKLNNTTNNILINSVGFTSTSVIHSNGINNIGLGSHGFKTGDKVYYEGDTIASGLTTGPYYVYKIDNDLIRLCYTSFDSKQNPPNVVSIASSGGRHQKLSLINPQIPIIRNNNLVFNLSDPSLEGYKLKLYYDAAFKNEFVSIATTDKFSLVGVGTTGISENASLTLTYNDNLPQKLYYNLEKGNYISSADTLVPNYSEISFINSDYNSTYPIGSVSPESFKISLDKIPEKLSYAKTECSVLEYITDSTTTEGPINKINIVSGGTGYKSIPIFKGTNSISGKNANIIALSDQIGDIKEVRIINEGFEYSSDRTLEPEAYISPFITIKDSNTIGIVTVTNGGMNYTSPPIIVVVDGETRKIVDNGLLEAKLEGTSISTVEIIQEPKGLSEKTSELFALNNSNGLSVIKVISSNTGIFTCNVTTPTLGFSTSPFKEGDEVFVEGIQRVGSAGSGFNSADYGYKFFTISEYKNSLVTPGLLYDQIVFDISDLTSNTGIAKTIQDSLGNLVKKDFYPSFSLTHKISAFNIGEKLISNGIERDLRISHFDDAGYIKVSGSYKLSLNDIIVGKESRNIAKIYDIFENSGRYKVNYFSKKDIGWSDNIGKLDYDSQVIPNNDYYQNLSYTIKSPIQYKDLKVPVDSLVHTSGLKNFSDTGISSTPKYIGIGSQNATTIHYDIIGDNRVDTIYDFDNVYDIDTIGDTSKFIKLQNKKLTDYTNAESNVVLRIDDINKKFSSLDGDPSEFLTLKKLGSLDSYEDYLIRISNLNNTSIQLTEFVLVNDRTNNFILNKGSLVNVGTGITHQDNESIGEFALIQDIYGDSYLRFTPVNPYDIDYNLKAIKNTFVPSLSGIGTTSIGFIDLTGFSGIITSPSSGYSGVTSSIIGVATDKFNSLFVNSKVIDNVTNEINFVELYITHNGTDTYISENYFDSNDYGYSINGIGSFSANINSDTDTLLLNYTNNTENDVTVKSNIVGFGTTAVGIGTYRFKLPRELDGYERSAIYQVGFTKTNSAIPVEIISLDKTIFNSFKSIVEVGMGVSKALHQIMVLHDQNDVYMQQSQFLSVGSDSIDDYISGIGTFGAEISGNNFILKFYPDSEMTSDINISTFDECLYSTVDFINEPPSLVYGNNEASVDTYRFDAINGDRINRREFVLTSNGTPIFGKQFNPEDSTIVSLSNGLFTIKDHFFSNGEKLVYTPHSTFVGVASVPMTYSGGGEPGSGHIVPSIVYAIKENDDQFKLATTRSKALAGTNIVFDSVGEGNAHQLAMFNNNSKSFITIDNVAQYPILYTPIVHTLSGNNGGIGIGVTIFALSGISSIKPANVLKIDDEYMVVDNVGFGTTSSGPITGIGVSTIVQVKRASIGSSATTHSDGAESRVYKGSYNISGDQIFFTQAPRGNPQIDRDESNLKFETSDFLGRVFLRNSYATNEIYDDISEQFTGVGATFNLTVGGGNTIGIGTSGGNGILFINSIFQTPTTVNNPDNNFIIIEDEPTGVTSITFSGITSSDGTVYTSDYDVNRNQLPRGGLIVSLGSTIGRGYAPLVGSKIEPIVNSSKSITGIIGIGTTVSALSISTASYDNKAGILSVTTTTDHGFVLGIVNDVKMVGLHFTCSGSYNVEGADYNQSTGNLTLAIGYHHFTVGKGVQIENNSLTFTCNQDGYGTNHTYPRSGTDPMADGVATPVIGVGDTTITINVGIGTTAIHKFVSATAGALKYGNEYVGVTTTIFPDAANDRAFPITGILSSHTFTADVGISTVTHYYVGQGTVFGWKGDLTFGSGYNDIINIGVAVTDPAYEHKFVSAVTNAITVNGGGSGPFTPTDATYSSYNGILTLTIPNHNLVAGSNTVGINGYSLTFTCSRDNHATEHSYPRSTDPKYGVTNVAIASTTLDTITLDIGAGGGKGSGAVIKAYPVGVNTHTYVGGTVTGAAKTGGNYTHNFVSCGVGSIIVAGVGELTATNAVYTPNSGNLKLTFASNHNLTAGTHVIGFATESLTFTCSRDNHASEHSYPRITDPIHNDFAIAIGATTLKTLTVNVGTTPFVNQNVQGAVYNPATGIMTVTVPSTANYLAQSQDTVDNAIYDPVSGIMTVTVSGHGYLNGDYVKFLDNSLVFTCDKDGNNTEHSYPRFLDPLSDRWVSIANTTSNTFEVQVLDSIPSTNITNHTFVSADTNGLKKANTLIDFTEKSLIFTCAQDSHSTRHAYPRSTDPMKISQLGVQNVLDATKFEVNVGKSPNGSGGALEFAIESGGTNYCNPEIYVSQPSYENLEVETVSRLSGSATTTGVGLLVDIAVSAAQTTGVGSDTYDVSDFSISRTGYSFEDGDILRPVGLVTHRRSQSAISEFLLKVTDTFTDTFAVWQFGEFDYIDSIKNYQDGKRVRFPLYYNDELLSFEKDPDSSVNLTNALFIVINGVVQDPGVAYVFEGGTSFSFTAPPKEDDNIAIFFYRGTRGDDDTLITGINQSIEKGDNIQILKNNAIPNTMTQNERTVFDLSYSDKFETNSYKSQGIDEINPKPMSLIKQKTDRFINGEKVYKTRDSIEALVYPTAKIIGDLSSSDTTVFVDNAEFFGYDSATDFGGLIISGDPEPISAILNATVSAGTTVTIGIVTGGNGYVGSSTVVSISAPPEIGVGIGTTAIAEIPISNGSLTTPITFINPGLGYTIAPHVMVPSPNPVVDTITNITSIQGFAGIVTGITTCPGIGTDLGLKFTLYRDPNFNDLNVGYPIYIYNTTIGSGVTSIYTSDFHSIGIGTEFFDNIYRIDAISSDPTNAKIGIITCNIKSDSSVVGLGVTMNITNPVGQFSWGKLSGFSRDSLPISIGVTGKTTNLGLTTFPTIQRRDIGIRQTGALPKRIT